MLAEQQATSNAASVDAPIGGAYARRMRLSDRKIDSLAEKLVRWLEGQSDVQFLEGREAVLDAIIAEIQDERDLERRLDEDVERIMEQNAPRMKLEGVDPWVMRKKVRQQLARERGLVL
jgi:hypothetical protein